jgi:protein-S-isoprenylcysteine O-methyltransferase Ste14
MPTPLVVFLAFAAYAAVHSLLATRGAKRAAERAFGSFGRRAYRLAYNVFGAASLVPVLAIVAFDPGPLVYRFPPPWSALALLGQAAAVLAMGWTLFVTDPLHFVGLRQILHPDAVPSRQPADTSLQPADRPRLVVSGPYRWVRHPLYSFALVFLWLTPVMTTSLLALYVCFSLYLYVGSLFEERRLEAEFGEAYREYRSQVPRLVPRVR